jgi:hypothetical protein
LSIIVAAVAYIDISIARIVIVGTHIGVGCAYRDFIH